MEVRGPAVDRISNLPPNVIQTILTLMPMRDAFRTSILSHNWRDYCLKIPTLVFNNAEFVRLQAAMRVKILYIVYPILLVHQGPILEFLLAPSHLISCREIDQIILYLSRSPTLKKFTLMIGSGDDHKLLPAFFKLQNLTDLTLQNCVFQPSETCIGFSGLVSLYFYDVSITAKDFLRFISNCPKLKNFSLDVEEKHFLGSWNSDFVELFECLPSVEYLCMSCGSIKMQQNPTEDRSQTDENLFEHRDYSTVILDHLHSIKITNFTSLKAGMDFVKLMLAKSPMLKEVCIEIDQQVVVNDEVKMLKELLMYPRASARAEIRVERP